MKITDIVYHGNGATITFDDNSIAEGAYKYVGDELLIVGLNNAQKIALDVFISRNSTATSDLLSPPKLDMVGTGDAIFVDDIADLPTPVNGIITLVPGVPYVITGDVDLNGNRIVCNGINTISGISSETSFLRSTGLSASNPLIYSRYSLPMHDLSITADYAMEIDGVGDVLVALDWTAVNFVGCQQVGYIKNASNFVYNDSAFLGSANLEFDGTIATIAINNSLLSGISGETTLSLLSTLTVTRRFRIIYSSFVVLSGAIGISTDVSLSIPVESAIFDTVNFSGPGTYLSGITASDNKALFSNCVGIKNSTANGQMYMIDNVTTTVISDTVNFFKVLGTTTVSDLTDKFTHANNRLTCDAIVSRKYIVQCTISFTSNANNVCEFGFFDSTLGTIRTPSRTKSTANAAGRAENVNFMCVLEHTAGNYVEIHMRNTTGSNDILVTDMNVMVTELH